MKKLFLTLSVALVSVTCLHGQDNQIVQKLFQDAIRAMGGDAYLNVTDVVSEGQLFRFNREGQSSTPIKFADYTKFPDKSRYEEGNKKKEQDVFVFNLGTGEGWVQEGQKGVREAKPEEMESFKHSVKRSLDMICRFRYKDPENRLFYLGAGEGKDVTLEMVKLVDPENDEIILYFDRISKLPVKMEYHDLSSQGVRLHSVEEYSQWHMKQGVNTPLRVDRFLNGRTSSQHFILKITYNNGLRDDFFAKPIPPK
jgi:hypothetical protein